MSENQDKTFTEQVDAVLSGADTTSSHLEVLKVTPPLLRMAGVPNLPILMTARHVKTITQEDGTDSANYHGLGVELVKRLPELISDPVMIMDSISPDAKARNSVVIVTQMVDKENRPVIGAIRLVGRGNDLNGFEISANILTSAYGKDNFQSFIERNIAQGAVLYVDKEKSQELSKTPGIQFPDNFESLDFDTIIRKTNAFVNSEEEKKLENIEKNEGSMTADTNNANAQSARKRVQQIRDGMVKTLLEYIEKNPSNWQSGWNNIAAGAPYNGKTSAAYRGMNALYLAFLGAARGYKDTRWVTFNQAKELGASVKKGEKSAPVIFFEFYDRKTKRAFDNRTIKDMTEEEKNAYLKENVYAVMKCSSVFNAEQCHNFPERKEIVMSEEERANQNAKIETIIANSAAPIRYDGGSRAYYSPGTDSIHLPTIAAFDTMQDYYATALHEIAHSTGHKSRLNRDLSGGFGSESYAKEELRAELACVFMQMEQGIQLNGKHITNHAAYLNSWLKAAKNDTSEFFKAAADAQKIADYVAENYLQAADGAVVEEENIAQEQSEKNPMVDYLRAERLNRSAVTDAGGHAWDQENIRDWYTSAYPNDEAGLDIHPNATFKDLREEVNRPNPISVYRMLGEDSVVRERSFMRLAELTNIPYKEIYSAFIGETAAQKLENARAQARLLAAETGEPYVTIEWSEHQALNSYDVMSLSEADKKLAALDAQENKNEGYYKTKLHIDYVIEGDHNAYECCRFDIGTEGGGLVHHIDEFLKNDTCLDAEERSEAQAALEYFKRHIEVSEYIASPEKLAELSEEEQDDINKYVDRARTALNTSVPFDDYINRMPLKPEELKRARDAAHAADLPFSEGNQEEWEAFNDDGGYVYDGNMSVEDYKKMWELRELDENVKLWYTTAYPTDKNGLTLNEDTTFKDINESVFNPTEQNANIYEVLGGFATSELRDRVFTRLAEIKGVTYDEIFNAWAQFDYRKQFKEQNVVEPQSVDGKRNDKMSVQNHNDAQTMGEELSASPYWIKINLPDSAIGKNYGSNTLVRMPEGEYSYFGLFIPTKYLKQNEGKWQLTVGSNYKYRIDNDGRRVELTGQELRDSFAGMQIGKKPVRVAPSKAYEKTFAALEQNVPEEMKALPNWCVYRTWQRQDKDKKGKVLKSAVTGEGASSKNPKDWTDFNTALKYARDNGFAGVSFLLEAKNGITCIDLDECVKNAETGEMKERATKLIDSLKGTYMERSTSGNGVHIFLKDDILKGGKYRSTSVDAQKGDLEVFDDQRIISMTGNMFSETNALTRAGSAATVYLRSELGEQKQRAYSSDSRPRPTTGTKLSDSELIRWIKSSKKGSEFDALYSGKGLSGDKSNDDAKLAHLLLYFSGGDKEQTFRIMRESGQNRVDKPDSYYRHTIEKMDERITAYAKLPSSAADDLKSRAGSRKSGANGNGAN